ncbi:phosphate/phosphite/phosphonate ABC transporter substrate-binding protein [Desulfolithobacter sp.]
MKRPLCSLCTLLLLLLLSVSVSAHIVETYSGQPPVRIVILPCMDPVRVYKNFHPLAHYLEHKIQRQVILQVPRDYESFRRIIEREETDFAYLSAHVYLALRDYFSKYPSLSILTPSGRQQHHGLLIVRTDSGIDRVEDLRGRTLLFGAEQSTVKTLAARLLLREHGIDPEKDLKEYAYGSSCQKNAFNVYLGAYDATFICNYSRGVLNGGSADWPIPPGSLKVVARTRSSPTWIFTALEHVPRSLGTVVNKSLLSLKDDSSSGKKILQSIEAAGFCYTDEKYLRLLDEELQSP